MAPRKRAQVSARTVRQWRGRIESALKAVRQAEAELKKLKRSASIVATKSR